MLVFDPDDPYSNCVCLLLPGGLAALVDIPFFEGHGGEDWRVMGDVIFCKERRVVVVNPTALPRNRKERIRYRIMTLPRLVLGVPYDRMVDHISRNRWDNRLSNLRLATGSQNSMNRRGVENKTSRFKGVYWNNRRRQWVARVTFEGNTYHLGTFADETAAALAYNAFIKKHCPVFGYLNPIAGATATDEPTAVKEPPSKRKSKIKKLTLTEMRVRRINARLNRSKARDLKRRQLP